MDKINQNFQNLLIKQNFKLKITEQENAFLYEGNLKIEQWHIVHFGILLIKDDEHSKFQIVYNNLAQCSNIEDRIKWLEFLNKVNLNYGLYYYFCLENSGNVFARYINEVNVEQEKDIYYFLIEGSHLIKKIISEIQKQFGETIHF